MMLEGGKIDWAAHAHDAATVVTETIDFDQCIRLAYEFYKKHPDETLILVTADHETGGLGLGNSGTNLNIELQKYQQCSQEALTKNEKCCCHSFLGGDEIFLEEEIKRYSEPLC